MAEDVRARLLAERAAVTAYAEGLAGDHRGIVEAAGGSNADDEHDPEGATIAFERAQVEALLRQARGRLAELDRALAREGAGSYGVCRVCHAAIPEERLAARPAAETCASCAEGGRR